MLLVFPILLGKTELTAGKNKLQCLSLQVYEFAGRVRANPSGASYSDTLDEYAPGITHKH